MTFTEIVLSYVNLLIIQYNDKPKARATIDLIISRVFGEGNLLLDNQIYGAVIEALNIKTAIGNQLTLLAKEEGVSRYYNGMPLSDEDLRVLFALKTIGNNADSTEYNIDQLFFNFFGNDIIIEWRQNMAVYIYTNYSLTLFQIIIRNNLLPLPTCIGFTVFYNEFDILFVDTRDLNTSIYPQDSVNDITLDLVITT